MIYVKRRFKYIYETQYEVESTYKIPSISSESNANLFLISIIFAHFY